MVPDGAIRVIRSIREIVFPSCSPWSNGCPAQPCAAVSVTMRSRCVIGV